MGLMTALPHRLDRTGSFRPAATLSSVSSRTKPGGRRGAPLDIDARPAGRCDCWPRRHGSVRRGDRTAGARPHRVFMATRAASRFRPAAHASRSSSPTAPGAANLSHEFGKPRPRRARARLALSTSSLANVAADEVNAGAVGSVDAWFRVVEPNAGLREAAVSGGRRDVRFRDRFSLIDSLADLVGTSPPANGSYRARMEQRGEIRHCQGTVLVD